MKACKLGIEVTELMKSAILDRLKEIAKSEDVLEHRKEFNELRSQLSDLLDHGITSLPSDQEKPSKEEETEAKEELDTSTESPDQVTEKEDELPKEIIEARSVLDECTEVFREKLKKAKEAKRLEELRTVEEAQALLSELKELVAGEENIGKAFSRFNAVRDKWKELPKVGNDHYRNLNADYNKYVEQFFYNINIYKELQELDLKHNLEEKLVIIEDQKKLLEENDIRLLEVEVRLNQDRWNEIGPTFKEEWDKIKGEFWDNTRAIYSKIQEKSFFEFKEFIKVFP